MIPIGLIINKPVGGAAFGWQEQDGAKVRAMRGFALPPGTFTPEYIVVGRQPYIPVTWDVFQEWKASREGATV